MPSSPPASKHCARERIDRKLARREKELLTETDIDWDAIAPKLSDPREQEILKQVVNEATNNNETVGAVLERLKKLGTEGAALAKRVRELLPV